MKTLVVGEHHEISEWLERRRALGQDGRDEVWEGVYHVAPHASGPHAQVAAEILGGLRPAAQRRGLIGLSEFNLGKPNDFRVPDGGWVVPGTASGLYVPTAAVILEVLSPDDETYDKLTFYVMRGVVEVLIAEPNERWVHCHTAAFGQQDRSQVFDVDLIEFARTLTWP